MNDVFSGADKKDLRTFHQNALKKASETLIQQTEASDVQKRLITGLTVSVSNDRISWVQQKINDLLKEVAEDATQNSPDNVYQFSVQFFPLTHE